MDGSNHSNHLALHCFADFRTSKEEILGPLVLPNLYHRRFEDLILGVFPHPASDHNPHRAMILFFFGRCSFVFLPCDEGACAVVLLSFFLFGSKGGQEIDNNCGRKNFFSLRRVFFNNFLSRCQNARAIKKNARFIPPSNTSSETT